MDIDALKQELVDSRATIMNAVVAYCESEGTTKAGVIGVIDQQQARILGVFATQSSDDLKRLQILLERSTKKE